jgi:hypothetical protein
MIDAFTDYPFTELGDVAGKKAPIRQVKILTYDWNKYCKVLVLFKDEDGDLRGHLDSVKSGYIYKREVRIDDADDALDFFTHNELKQQLPLSN